MKLKIVAVIKVLAVSDILNAVGQGWPEASVIKTRPNVGVRTLCSLFPSSAVFFTSYIGEKFNPRGRKFKPT
jgi:hypothetical protein